MSVVIENQPNRTPTWIDLGIPELDCDDTDAAVQRALAVGGKAGEIQQMIYGRFADITDPFGVQFPVIARP
jgi:hypothetical protein